MYVHWCIDGTYYVSCVSQHISFTPGPNKPGVQFPQEVWRFTAEQEPEAEWAWWSVGFGTARVFWWKPPLWADRKVGDSVSHASDSCTHAAIKFPNNLWALGWKELTYSEGFSCFGLRTCAMPSDPAEVPSQHRKGHENLGGAVWAGGIHQGRGVRPQEGQAGQGWRESAPWWFRDPGDQLTFLMSLKMHATCACRYRRYRFKAASNPMYMRWVSIMH